MVLILSIKADVRRATRDLDNLARKQIPFAQAQAVNSLAGLVQNAEKQEIRSTFPTATPFTVASVKVARGRKSDPTATVYLGQIAEPYLAPYISGGRHFLGGKRGILNPKGIGLNRYGNIPKGKLQNLKGEPDIFVGSIKTKDGQSISGVWQRPTKNTPGPRIKGQKGPRPNTTGKLKLLVRFGDSLTVTEHLNWFETADHIVRQHAEAEMDIAMKKALATARP